MSESTLKKVLQLGIVVADAQKSAETFCELFDIPVEEVRYIHTDAPTEYKGQTVRAELKIAMVTVANLEFEFLQHVSGDYNSQKDFLEQHGPGIQHICILPDNYQRTVDKMTSLGGEVLVDGGVGGYDYKYMDMRDSMGLVFEMYSEAMLKKNQKDN